MSPTAAQLNSRNIANMLVPETASLSEALTHMEEEAALIVNDKGQLIGMLTDGDVRRAILKGSRLEDPVKEIMTVNPITVHDLTPDRDVRALLLSRKIRHLPVIDQEGRPIYLHCLKDYYGELNHAGAVVMAGGKGTRLRPLTLDTPKPLLKIGDQPILDTILDGLKAKGVDEVVLTVNYLSEQIKAHVGDGKAKEMSINYVEEEQQLGTAGALALMDPRPKNAFIVMNGDLFTELDYRSFINFHREEGNDLTVCVRRHVTTVPYGVVTIDESHTRINNVVEKPELCHLVNAGIYIMEPHLIDLIPRGEPFDMVRMIHATLDNGFRVGAFPIIEYWCDIGQHQDMAQAQQRWREQAARTTKQVPSTDELYPPTAM